MDEPAGTDTITTARRGRWRSIRHFAYVDRPFRDVRRAVAAAPQALLGESAGATPLRLHRGGLDLSRDVRLVLGDVQIGTHSARLPIHWEDALHPALFPILEAILEVAPVAAGRRSMTQLGLLGRYQPPLGRLGALGDTLVGREVVLQSVESFLDELVDRFEAVVPAAPPEDAGTGTGPEAAPRHRRIVLPVDGLPRRPGGAAGVELRLQSEPGVLEASVSPTSELAVIDYDDSACTAGHLLRILESGW